MSVNVVHLLGRVGKDPEIKQFDGGSKASFSVATTERGYTTKNGVAVPEKTEWHNIVCWKGLATIAERFVKKGDLIYIEGKITTRNWESDGKKHYMTEIVADNIELLGNKSEKVEKDPFEEPPMGEPVYRENKFDNGINADDTQPF
jgi:single-strand DNA-binding protein